MVGLSLHYLASVAVPDIDPKAISALRALAMLMLRLMVSDPLPLFKQLQNYKVSDDEHRRNTVENLKIRVAYIYI